MILYNNLQPIILINFFGNLEYFFKNNSFFIFNKKIYP